MKHFVDKLEHLGLYLRYENGKLKLEGDKNLSQERLDAVKGDKEIIHFIKENREQLIDYISTIPADAVGDNFPDITAVYPLSSLQEGMLFHGLFDAQAGGYAEQFVCDLVDLNTDVFQECWNYLFQCHSILRSSFHHDRFNIPVQCVHQVVKMPFEILDFRHLDEVEQIAAFQEYQAEEYRKGIDFNMAPLMRIGLIRWEDNRYRMLWTHHHILTDGWSMQILIEELLLAYEQLMTHKQLIPRSEDLYEDYIRYIRSKNKVQEESYWRKHFEGVSENCLSPFITEKADRNKGIGGFQEEFLQLDNGTTRRLITYAKQCGVTLNTVIQGIWSFLLYGYTGKDDIIFGVTVSGRPHDLEGVEKRVGLYINTLPLCVKINPEQKIGEWLQYIQQKHVESREYQYTSLNTIQEWVGIPGDLFDSLLVFENYPVSGVVASRKWLLHTENIQVKDHVNYPLSIRVVINPDEISVRFSYNNNLLNESYIKHIKAHFEQVLKQMIESPQEKVGRLMLHSATQLNEWLKGANMARVAYPEAKTVIDLFESQAALQPAEVAVVSEGREISYGELNAWSNQLAHYLMLQGVKSGMPVAICMDRGIAMIAGILGIMKAGGVYVPVDPDFPSDRIRYMLKDAACQVIITGEELIENISVNAGSGTRIINIDREQIAIVSCADHNPDRQSVSDDLAYIMYTSGSTGRPKGVMIRHSSLVDYVYGLQDRILIGECRTFGLVSTLSTDLGNTVVYASLLLGGTLHILSRTEVNDPELMHSYFRQHRIDCLKIVPSHWKALRTADHLLLPAQLLIFGGEALSSDIIESIYSSSASPCRIVNHYGPTETTVGKLLHVVDRDRRYGHTIPIGRPFSNTQVYILGRDLSVCAVGIPGELYIAGDGIAAGYWQNKELTDARFVKCPFSEDTSVRMYKTGDLCRWLADGSIEYLGRTDDQVKIRGYRIELGEIGNVLEESGLVSQGVVLARADAEGNKRLVGYVVTEGVFEKDVLLAYMRARLPEYMVPGLWVQLEQIPLTLSGKIDRQAFPDPDVSVQLKDQYEAPRNVVEEKLAAIWKELLKAERIGIHDDFFELGGHSLLATRVISAIRRELSIALPIRVLFEFRTINALGKYVDLTLTDDGRNETNTSEYKMMEL